jgi:hypothetical protein
MKWCGRIVAIIMIIVFWFENYLSVAREKCFLDRRAEHMRTCSLNILLSNYK